MFREWAMGTWARAEKRHRKTAFRQYVGVDCESLNCSRLTFTANYLKSSALN